MRSGAWKSPYFIFFRAVFQSLISIIKNVLIILFNIFALYQYFTCNKSILFSSIRTITIIGSKFLTKLAHINIYIKLLLYLRVN